MHMRGVWPFLVSVSVTRLDLNAEMLPGLLLGTEAPVLMPNGVHFVFSFLFPGSETLLVLSMGLL